MNLTDYKMSILFWMALEVLVAGFFIVLFSLLLCQFKKLQLQSRLTWIVILMIVSNATHIVSVVLLADIFIYVHNGTLPKRFYYELGFQSAFLAV